MCGSLCFLVTVFLCVDVDSVMSTVVGCNESTPEDCSEIKTKNPSAATGVYKIRLMDTPCGGVVGEEVNGQCCVEVYCDMDRFGGGWMVFQKRYNGKVDFYRKWTQYEFGFGSLAGEFYAGNKLLFYFTGRRTYELLVELEPSGGKCRFYAHYSSFQLTNSTEYRLSLGSYTGGTAGDRLHNNHDGMAFTTYDQDNDITGPNCASVYRGGWWYQHCHSTNLNGEYFDGCSSAYATRMTWTNTGGGQYYSFKGSEMKLRPVGYK